MAAHIYTEGQTGVTQGISQFVLFAALALGLLFVSAPQAQAQATGATTDTTETRMATNCGKHVGLTNRIAGCVRDTVDNVTARFFDQDDGFYKLVSRFIAGFMTLGVAIYGVMAAAGMLEKVGRDTLMFLVKMSFIAWFTLNADVMYRTVIQAMDAAGSVVVRATPDYGLADGNKDFANIQCYQAMKKAADSVDGSKPLVGPWLAMDCLIDTVFGLKPYSATPAGHSTDVGGSTGQWFNDQLEGKGLERGMIFFFFSGMKTSVLGLMMGVLGFIFMWGIITMIIKSLMTYIGAYIGIAFMMVISPLFIPLLLFRTTKEYFDKWVKLTLSFAMQPVLILLFISLSIAAVDLAIFSGDYSVMYRVAGNASRVKGFSINNYLKDTGAVEAKAFTPASVKTTENIEATTTQLQDGLTNLTTGKCNRQNWDTDPECAGMPIQMWRDTIDWEKLAAARAAKGPPVTMSDGATSLGQQISREVMAAIVFCGVVIFVMNRLMAVVPHIIVDLVGDMNQTPNLLSNATRDWNQGAAQMSGQITGGITGAFESMTTQRRSP